MPSDCEDWYDNIEILTGRSPTISSVPVSTHNLGVTLIYVLHPRPRPTAAPVGRAVKITDIWTAAVGDRPAVRLAEESAVSCRHYDRGGGREGEESDGTQVGGGQTS